ncbi:DUF2059 domain-containing protein [uncultured Lentibacter sp.]|uniref:DUF2059 domain-containing protein n=1 Tax=uncultured Lentibacter sp. TaxID=1659309 RepID=UPI002617D46B|nr:DUF2059 domain-containing protein [uncultured Lentibacter sp.]
MLRLMLRGSVLGRVGLLCAALLAAGSALAAPVSDARLEAFLRVTGFDVALESMRLGATDAPQMLGLEASDFGLRWTQIADEVFAPEAIRAEAKALLGAALSPQMLEHAAEFYASALGLRLVAVENAAHAVADTPQDVARGEALLAEMRATGAARLQILQRMNHAIDPQNIGVEAMQEVQIRFLLAASDAGVIARIDEAALRSLMQEQASALAEEIEQLSLAAAARIYEPFSDAELLRYAQALEHPTMQQVYELMNGVQNLLTGTRYEQLALRLAELGPAQEL